MIPAGQPRRDNFRMYEPPMSRRDLALEAGFDPSPDDLLPPAAHLVESAAEDWAKIAATVGACDDCNRLVCEDDLAPSCGVHYLCVSCFETSDFRCRECRRVWDEVNAA